MKVSIITVCLNSAQTIEHTIRSILAQDHGEIEHIVVDGVSTDGTMEILRAYSKRIEIIVSEPDTGIYDAMNKGIHLATGDVIALLNSDDEYVHDHVISDLTGCLSDPKIDGVFGDLVYVDRHDPRNVTRTWIAGPYHEGAFFRGWVPPHPTFVCRRDVYQRLGGFDTRFKVAADFELMLRFIAKNHIRVAYLNEVLVRMRTGGRANRLPGVLQGNLEMVKAFRVNGLPFPWQMIASRPASRLCQVIWGRRKGRPPVALCMRVIDLCLANAMVMIFRDSHGTVPNGR